MESKATSPMWAIDQDGKTWLHLCVEDGQAVRAFATKNKDKALRLKLTEWRDKRSLTANAYAWVMLGKLSEKLGIPPEEIYWRLIPDVGGNYTTITTRLDAVKELRELWCRDHIGRRIEIIGASAPGMVDLMVYKGSSDYDTAQMARLIDLIIQECREQDVEYLPPDKLIAMLEEWHEIKKNQSTGD